MSLPISEYEIFLNRILYKYDFGQGLFLWRRSQDEDRNEQRQGIIITMISCLLCDKMIISQRLPPVLSYAQSGREPL